MDRIELARRVAGFISTTGSGHIVFEDLNTDDENIAALIADPDNDETTIAMGRALLEVGSEEDRYDFIIEAEKLPTSEWLPVPLKLSEQWVGLKDVFREMRDKPYMP